MRPLANRRGQIQLGEMVLVLVFAFILGLGALIFFTQQGASTSARETINQQQLALTVTAKQIATMPSLRASIAGSADLTVIDSERATAFSRLVRDPVFRSVYRERYAGYSARIEPVYPPGDDYAALVPPQGPPFSSIELFDFTDADAAARNSIPFTVPILLADPVTGRASFALLTVTQVVP